MEYWMASNHTSQSGRAEAIEEVLQDPGSAILFVGYPRWLLHFAASCCVLFMLVGIPGNLFTIIALFRTRKLRNATAIFIMNLSISDLMFCCFNLPLAASTFWHSSWRHGALLCRLFPLLRYGLVAVSLFTILAITINRYIMIGHPRFYPTVYKRKYLIPMVLGTWVVAFGVLIVTWFESWGRFGLDTAIGSCSILPDAHGRSPKEFLFVVAFLIPCVAIVVCYARIFYIVRKTASKSRKRSIAANIGALEVSREQRSTSPRNQEGELSVFGSSCTPSGFCKSLSPKRSIAPSNRLNVSRSPLRSEIQESLSELQSSSQNSTNEARRAETEIKSEKSMEQSAKEGLTSDEVNSKVSTLGAIEICDKANAGSEVIINDIPYVDERDDLDVTEDVFLDNDRDKIKDSPVKGSANARNKLERMASRASFIIDSAFWVQKLSSKTSMGLETSRSSSLERSARRKGTIDRRESRFKSVRRIRNAEAAPRMSSKDRKLLKMILVIFSSFLVCYLPITVAKTFKNVIDWRGFNIAGYILIYLTTCINPVVYVVMSSEYRSAYKNVLFCRNDSGARNGSRKLLG